MPAAVASPGCFLPVPLEKGRSRALGIPAPSPCSICTPRMGCSLLLAAGNCRRCCLASHSRITHPAQPIWTADGPEPAFPPRSFGGRCWAQESIPAQLSSLSSVPSWADPGPRRDPGGAALLRDSPGLPTPHLTPTPGVQPPLALLDSSRWIIYPSRDLPWRPSYPSSCKNHSNFAFDVSQTGSAPQIPLLSIFLPPAAVGILCFPVSIPQCPLLTLWSSPAQPGLHGAVPEETTDPSFQGSLGQG